MHQAIMEGCSQGNSRAVCCFLKAKSGIDPARYQMARSLDTAPSSMLRTDDDARDDVNFDETAAMAMLPPLFVLVLLAAGRPFRMAALASSGMVPGTVSGCVI